MLRLLDRRLGDVVRLGLRLRCRLLPLLSLRLQSGWSSP